jgi:pyrroloquinoline quinone biosynthesis protein E
VSILRPFTLVAELTYGCPLRCAYCSNPVSVTQRAAELTLIDWQRVIHEAEALGVVHVHFTGGEPLLHPELEALVASARSADLYVNLITSGVPLKRERLQALRDAGLEHVQLSLQAATPELARQIAGVAALEQKTNVARWVRELGLALTINVVLHRQNAPELSALLELAERLEPSRIEIANAQYLGWALENRAALLPSSAQLEQARAQVDAARLRLRGKIDLLFVLPDYHAGRPRACMQGWAQRYLIVTPDGLLLPCQAARDIADLQFDDVRNAPLGELWSNSPALCRFRGEAWLPEPCRSCDERERDFAGCRCQAFRLTGDAGAPDPACHLTPAHALLRAAREHAERPLATEPLHLRRPPRYAS